MISLNLQIHFSAGKSLFNIAPDNIVLLQYWQILMTKCLINIAHTWIMKKALKFSMRVLL